MNILFAALIPLFSLPPYNCMALLFLTSTTSSSSGEVAQDELADVLLVSGLVLLDDS